MRVERKGHCGVHRCIENVGVCTFSEGSQDIETTTQVHGTYNVATYTIQEQLHWIAEFDPFVRHF